MHQPFFELIEQNRLAEPGRSANVNEMSRTGELIEQPAAWNKRVRSAGQAAHFSPLDNRLLAQLGIFSYRKIVVCR